VEENHISWPFLQLTLNDFLRNTNPHHAHNAYITCGTRIALAMSHKFKRGIPCARKTLRANKALEVFCKMF